MEDGLFRTRRKQERTLRQGRKQRGTDEKAEKGFFRENFICSWEKKSIASQTLKPSPRSLGCTHLMLQMRRMRPREVRAAQGHRAENAWLVRPATPITSVGLSFLNCQ